MRRPKVELVPVVYEHAAMFLGKTPGEVACSAELLAKAHEAAWREYQHGSIVVGIDAYNLEAECYGACVVVPEGNQVPSIRAFPFRSCEEIRRLALLDPENQGRFPLVFEAARRLRERLPGVDIRIPLAGPFSIASNLMGLENLLVEALVNPELVKKTLLHLTRGQVRVARFAQSQGFDVIFFESAATPPLLSPELFRRVEKPSLAIMLDETASIDGVRPLFIMGGNTFPILPDVLECGPSGIICPAETDQEAFMRYLLPHKEPRVRINMVVEVVARGTQEMLFQETRRVYRLARGRDPILIGTGVLPYDVSPTRIHQVRGFLQELRHKDEEASRGP